MTKQVSLFDVVRVPYETGRSREIQNAYVGVRLDVELPSASLKEFEPLYRWEGLPADTGDRFYVRDNTIYSALCWRYYDDTWFQQERFNLPRGARPLNDGRAHAVAHLRKLIEGGYVVDGDIMVPSLPLYPRLVIGFDGFRLEQFYAGMVAVDRHEFSGFATNRLAQRDCRDHYHLQLPFNMLHSGRSSNFVGETMRMYGSDSPLHDINPQWVHFTLTRPDLVPRQSEVHAAAVTACLMAAAVTRRSGVTSDLDVLEYSANMVKQADRAMLGICQLDVIETMLDELPAIMRRIGDYSEMSWQTRTFLTMCGHVMRNGEHVEVQPSEDILRMFSATLAHSEWEVTQIVNNNPSLLDI